MQSSDVACDSSQPTSDVPTTSIRKKSTSKLEKKYITKSQKIASIQNIFTGSQKIAYCGLCYLSIHQYKSERLIPLKAKPALDAYDRWAKGIVAKLFLYLDLSDDEQQMIHQLADHGILVSDLSISLLSDAKHAAEQIKNHPVHNPESDSEDEDEDGDIPSDIRYTVLSHLFILCICDGLFDSRSRSLLRQVSSYLQIPWLDVLHLEKAIAQQLRLSEASSQLKEDFEVVGTRNKIEGKRRWLYMSLATLAGGAVIGLTAGLAAPFIGAGIGAALTTVGISAGAGITGTLTSTAGIAIITSTGVLTGGGMGGFKMLKRTRGVTEFEFLSIEDGLERIEETKITKQEEREKKKRNKRDSQNSPKTTPSATFTPSSQSSFSLARKPSGKSTPSNFNYPKSATPKPPQQPADVLFAADANEEYSEFSKNSQSHTQNTINLSSDTSVPHLDFDLPPSPRSGNTNVLITIAGWITYGIDDYTLPFSTLAPNLHGEQYTLIWESKSLAALGSTLTIIVAEMASFLVQQGIQAFALPMLMAALTGPMWALKLSYLIDNPWGIGLSKAKKTGKVLADTLINQVQENRPVTLIGYSLGARVIYFCLEELARRGAYGIVEEAYLFGCPVMSTRQEWTVVSSVVSGKIVNGYMRNDYVLGVLYRASSAVWSEVAGLRPVEGVEGIENISLDGVVKGHLEYRIAMPMILKKCGFTVTQEYFEDEEDEMERIEEEILRKKREEERKRAGFGFGVGAGTAAAAKRAHDAADITKQTSWNTIVKTKLEKEERDKYEKLQKENPQLWLDLLRETRDVQESRRLLALFTQPKELATTMPTLVLSSENGGVSEDGPNDSDLGAGVLADRCHEDDDENGDAETIPSTSPEPESLPVETSQSEIRGSDAFAYFPEEKPDDTWTDKKTKESEAMDKAAAAMILKETLQDIGVEVNDAWGSSEVFAGIPILHSTESQGEMKVESKNSFEHDDEDDWGDFNQSSTASSFFNDAEIVENVKDTENEPFHEDDIPDVPLNDAKPNGLEEMFGIDKGFAGLDLDDPWQ